MKEGRKGAGKERRKEPNERKNRKEGMGGRDGHSRAIKLKKGVYNL